MKRTFRYFRIVAFLFCGGCLCLCLATGCQVSPMPANKVFGTSNPTLRAKVSGYGVLEIPTNFDGDFTFDKKPDGSISLIVKVKSNASGVVDAEGNRIPMMDAFRQVEAARMIEERKIAAETMNKALDVIGTAVPMLGSLGSGGSGLEPSALRDEMRTEIRAMVIEAMRDRVAPGPVP